MRGGISILLLTAVLSMVFVSCQQKTFDSKEALLAYIQNPENGFLQKKHISGIEISLLYRPTDLLVSQEIGENTSKVIIDSLRKKYSNYLYFNLSLSKNGQELLSAIPKDRDEFGAMVNELAFDMKEKVHLVTSNHDTIEMVDYVYPRLYGMGRKTSIMFIYLRDQLFNENDFLSFSIEDIGIGYGKVTFKIPIDYFKFEPQLNFY